MSVVGQDRLPPNPRRNKVPVGQRKRIATACNYCNVRRIRCSGDTPCVQCSKLQRECIYPVQVEKVTVSKSELDQLRGRCAALEKKLQEYGSSQSSSTGEPSIAQEVDEDQSVGVRGAPNEVKAETTAHLEDEEPPPTHGRLLRDGEGRARYLGETSGATFLDALKSFMMTMMPLAFKDSAPACLSSSGFLDTVGQYLTLDSHPIVLPSVDPLWLPPQEEMERLLHKLRDFIEDGNGTYPSGGLCYWGGITSVPPDPRAVAPSSNFLTPGTNYRHLALHQTAFACATVVDRTAMSPGHDGPVGEGYFARARMLLGNPLDTTLWSPADLPVLGLMAMYLAEHNRRDAASMAIGTAMHIAIMHGMHKGWSVDETGKRIFWTIYTVDRWMSLLMGRPPAISDEAITLDLPQDDPDLPPAVGLRASVKLCRISSFISANSYRLTPRSFAPNSSVSYFDEALQRLADWYLALPKELQLGEESLSRDRAAVCLHLAYNQLLILTIRPILLLAVKKGVADQFTNRRWGIDNHPQIARIRQCSDAARRNLRLGRWLLEISPAHKLLLPELHYIFNAAIILMLHQIVFVNLRTHDVSEIEFAIEAFAHEAESGAAYAQVCAGVLKDLSALVQRLRSLTFDRAAADQDASYSAAVAEQQQQPLSSSLSRGPMMSGVEGQPDTPCATGGDVFQVLDAWLRDDDVQLYNSFLI